MNYETWRTMQCAANKAWQNMDTTERAKMGCPDRAQAMDAAPDSEILPVSGLEYYTRRAADTLRQGSFASLPREIRDLANEHAQLSNQLAETAAGGNAELARRLKRQMDELESELERLGYPVDKKATRRAADALPQSDFDYYTRCAAESTRLA
jgi:hypothetical protein